LCEGKFFCWTFVDSIEFENGSRAGGNSDVFEGYSSVRAGKL